MTPPTQPPVSDERLDRLIGQLLTERGEDVAAAALTAEAVADRLANRLGPRPYDRTMMVLAAAALLVAVAAGAIALGSGLLRPESVDLQPGACLPAQPAITPLAGPDAGGSWAPTGPMTHRRREGHTVTVLTDGKVLVAGAADAGEAEIFDPQSDTWAATQGMLTPRTNHTATLLQDGRVLVAGGEADSAFTDPGSYAVASAELYDPEAGTWTETGGMALNRARAAAVLLPDCTVLVVGGGVRSPDFVAELYDPASGTWSALPGPGPLRATGVESMTLLRDGRVLMSDGALEAHLYDHATRTWSLTSPMVQLGSGSGTATLLPDGRVLFAGGGMFPSSPFAKRAQLYDPASDTWTETSPMNEGHVYHTAALLHDGTVLVAGGGDGGYGGFADAERYDPATDTWTVVTDMLEPHGWSSGTTLHDGRVLVVGGYGDGSDPGAEIYDPSAGG